MIRSGTLRYARFQAGDFLMQKVSLPAILVLVIGGLTVYGVGHAPTPIEWASPDGKRFARQILNQTLPVFSALTAFLGVNAMVSGDRHHGHARFYFSKPVHVPWFYLQGWLVGGLVMVTVAGLLAALLQAFTTTIPVAAAMASAALSWTLVGGFGFLLSVLMRFDGAVLISTWLLAAILRDMASRTDSPLPQWARMIAKVLPPVDRLDAVRSTLLDGGTPGTSALTHVIGYGLAGLVLGTILLRRRSLVT